SGPSSLLLACAEQKRPNSIWATFPRYSLACCWMGSVRRSKPRQVGTRHAAGVDMHTAELGAAVQGRKDLAGIEQALVVEGAFEPLLLIEVDLRKHHWHQVALLDADA